jgi:Uma2 family endonuclease
MTAALHLPAHWDEREWTVDDLASLPEDLRYELIDGRLVLPSPTVIHQEIAFLVCLALRANCPPGLVAVLDMSLEINNRNEPRPDVVVVRTTQANRTPVPVKDSFLAVEVISPGSGIRDTHTKARVYASAGIADYLIIDPMAEPDVVLWHYRLNEAGKYVLLATTSGEFTADRPYPFTIDLPALTARRKELLG